MTKRIYIAGPITGVEGYKDRFERAEEILKAAGYEPASPIAEGLVEGGMDVQGLHQQGTSTPRRMRRDLSASGLDREPRDEAGEVVRRDGADPGPVH